MDHIAIDLGGTESQICWRRSDGTIVEEKRIATLSLKSWLAKREASRVIFETCAESFSLADAAKALGHDVRVVPATLAPSLGVGARRTKTDRRDAQALSSASCRIELPSVHVPALESRQRKTLCGMRDALVATRTQLINTVRGWLRSEAVRVRRGATESFAARVRDYAQDKGLELPSYVRRQLTMLDAVGAQIEDADAELEALAKSDPVCRRLMTVPGVGPSNAVLFTATLDEIGRFPTAAAVASYLGLTPGEHSSSSSVRRIGITKAGSPRMRRLLLQAAWAARRCRKEHPMVLWSLEVEKRRGRRVAVTALARKIAGILFAIWRDGTLYDSTRGATVVEPAPDPNLEAALAMLRPSPE